MILRNCTLQKEKQGFCIKRISDGAFGFKKTITLQALQKVYTRIVVHLGDKFAKVRIGVLDDGEWYVEEKVGRGTKTLSVVRMCSVATVDIIVTVEFTDDLIVSDFITETVGDTKIEKRILDKIEYCEKDIVNVWLGEPFRITSENGRTARKEISCELEKGKGYFIKMLTEEVTDCGRMWLECGHSQAVQKGQLVKAFKYIENLPILAIKGDRFDYIVDVKAVVIADCEAIKFHDFLNKGYWR